MRSDGNTASSRDVVEVTDIVSQWLVGVSLFFAIVARSQSAPNMVMTSQTGLPAQLWLLTCQARFDSF